MQFDGDALTIDASMGPQEVEALGEFIRSRIDYIETIHVDEASPLACTPLLALLVSLKRARNGLKIPFIERGATTSPIYGTLHWICHE